MARLSGQELSFQQLSHLLHLSSYLVMSCGEHKVLGGFSDYEKYGAIWKLFQRETILLYDLSHASLKTTVLNCVIFPNLN